MDDAGGVPADADGGVTFLRHTVAVLAYRAGKVLRDAPAGYATRRVGESIRTPVEILAHVGDLLDWARSMAEGNEAWRDSPPLPWDEEVRRFLDALARLDATLAAGPPARSPERLFQGPIADALTHVGQLAMLRRAAGAPIRGENYSRAEVTVGRLGLEQAAPRREFD